MLDNKRTKIKGKKRKAERDSTSPSKLVKKKKLPKAKVEGRKEENEREKEAELENYDEGNREESEEKEAETKPETSKKSVLPSLDEDELENPEEKQRKSGVIYFSMIPPKFSAVRLRKYFEDISPGQIGRIHLVKNKFSRSIENRYKEGWMEVKKKKLAKAIAAQIDNTPIGGKNRDYVSYLLWNIRYLPGFKWVHLVEQLEYEKLVEDKRMQMEIAQARKVAAHFEEQIHKGKYLKKLEEKVREKGGEWTEAAPRKAPSQKKTVKRKREEEMVDDDVMKMIFAED